MDKEQLQTLYLQEEYYWGKEPNQLAKSVLNYYQDEPVQGKRAVDLGAGEGRDSVFLARQGFAVTAMDFAPAGLEKAKRLAVEMGTTLHTVEGDINQFLLTEPVDLLYSIGALQYIYFRCLILARLVAVFIFWLIPNNPFLWGSSASRRAHNDIHHTTPFANISRKPKQRRGFRHVCLNRIFYSLFHFPLSKTNSVALLTPSLDCLSTYRLSPDPCR
ncbi:class I SAM-dependent methyltransferase [Brevibacillus nitrificans]|uniref:class I SAM-dependent methyltransferase n=1 Tax=Brevibacillus TaxID=55080 RepID=UPI00286BE6E1|nr:class I SAM-dependent methyltransferase [Brevibacillus nitrificans]